MTSSASADDGLRDYFEPIMRRCADRLNARHWRWAWVPPSYHMLADALFWPDEWLFGRARGECEDLLRVLWHHRTGLILGEPREYADIWQLGKEVFPRWVGFHPSRSRPLRRYRAVYRAGNAATQRWIEQLEREIERENATER
jgi:hypothetical protein